MSQNYLNFKLDGTRIGVRKGEYLDEVGELVYIWDPNSGFIDPKNPLNLNVEVHNKLEMIPEGKLLVVMAMNDAFDAALCFADPWDFNNHWKTSPNWRQANDPRKYMYFMLDADKAKLMYDGGSGKDWDYMERRRTLREDTDSKVDAPARPLD